MKIGIENVLSDLSENQAKYLPHGVSSTFKVVKKIWRPYSRVYRIQAGQNGSADFFWVKMFKVPNNFQEMADKYLARLQTEFDITQKLQHAFDSMPDTHVVSPLAVLPQFGAVATWESKGKPLSDLIDKNGRKWSNPNNDDELADYVFKSGKALARLQEFTRTEEVFDPGEVVEYVDIRLQRLVKNKRAPFTEKDRNLVLKFIEKEVPKVGDDECQVCGVHSDFGAFNVLVRDGEITLTDFTSYKTGSPYVDLTYFYHRLQGFLHKPVFRENLIYLLQNKFLEGYGNPDVRHHKMFTLSLIRHTINNFSSLARNRRGGLGKIPLPHIQLFNRRIFRIYKDWLYKICV
ncbi:MAG: hypothetical protein DWQ05_18965 [Calditrichaeota bacterium]|nr:MAG: hypothetical protein DWQ05_18965 [Calditrichota bacterium]